MVRDRTCRHESSPVAIKEIKINAADVFGKVARASNCGRERKRRNNVLVSQ